MDLYLLSPPKKPFLDELPKLVETGIDCFQYRRPELTDQERYRELLGVQSLLAETSTKLIVNNRPDLAMSVGADGVHLGHDDLPVDPVKEQWPELIVGRTHRVDDDFDDRADYFGVGPVFSSFSKDLSVEPSGWGEIRNVLNRTSTDVYAIGGIDSTRLDDVPRGLAGICVIGAVWNSDDPVGVLRRLRKKL